MFSYFYKSLSTDSPPPSSSSSSSKDDVSSLNEEEKKPLKAWILYGANTQNEDLAEFTEKVKNSNIFSEILFNKVSLKNELIDEADELVRKIVDADLLIIVTSLENQIALMQIDTEFEKQGKPPIIVIAKQRMEKSDLHIMQGVGINFIANYEDADILVYGEDDEGFENNLVRVLIKRGILNDNEERQKRKFYREVRN